MTPTAKHTLRALLVACICALLLPLSAPAASRTVATTPCWITLMNEWYGGAIKHIYPIPCYHQAIDHLPGTISSYTSAREDIQRALAVAIAHQQNPSAPVVTVTTSHSGGPSGLILPHSSSGGATSFPLPLIILGGLALFLLAAGGVGLIVRRMQGRGPGTP